MPGIATLIGGVLTSCFGWLSCFYFLLIYGISMLAPMHFLEETGIDLKQNAMQINQIWQNYRIALQNKLLILTSLFISLSGAAVYLYIASSPFIAINTLEISAEKYGLIGFIPFVGTALGSMMSTKLAIHFPAKNLMLLGFIVSASTMITLAISFYAGIINFTLLIAVGFLLMLGNCIIVGNGASIASNIRR